MIRVICVNCRWGITLKFPLEQFIQCDHCKETLVISDGLQLKLRNYEKLVLPRGDVRQLLLDISNNLTHSFWERYLRDLLDD